MTPSDNINAFLAVYAPDTFYYNFIEGHLSNVPIPPGSHWEFGYVGPHHRFQIDLKPDDGFGVVSRTFSFEDYPHSPDEIMMGFGNLCNTMVKIFPKYIQRASDRRAANLLPEEG